MKKVLIPSIILGILILLYFIFPYYCIHNLVISLKEGDRYKLESYINFESLRASLKEQIHAKIMDEFIKDEKLKDNPFSGLAMLIGPKFVDYMLEAYLTPSGITSLMESGKLKKEINELQKSISSETESGKNINFWELLSKAKYAFFTNPSTFLVEIESTKFRFRLQDWSWKLTNIYLPKEAMDYKRKIKADAKKSDDGGNKRFSFKDLKGSFVNSSKAGKLFVITGMVINNYPDKRNYIRVMSNIWDSKGKVVKSKTIYAGNPISDKELLSLSVKEIDSRLQDKLGKNEMNMNILPGSSIPFMVIFSDLPEDISEFTVEAISSSAGAISTRDEMIDSEKGKEVSLSAYWIKTNSANIRSGPSTNNTILLTLKQGDKVYLINQLGKWCKVRQGEKEKNVGWIHSSLLSKSFVKSYQEKIAYLDKVVTRNVHISKSVLGDPGVFGEVKNLGDRTLTKVEITIYFLDKNGSPIFEKTYHPVLVSEYSFGDDKQPLKPNYSRKFGVRADDAPSEWARKIRVKVTNIELEE